MNTISSSGNLIGMAGISLDRLLKQRSALRGKRLGWALETGSPVATVYLSRQSLATADDRRNGSIDQVGDSAHDGDGGHRPPLQLQNTVRAQRDFSGPDRISGIPDGAQCRRRRSGFTIFEVILAVGVLALAITTAIAAMQRAFLALDTARNLETAGCIMQCELEKERLFSWAQVNDGTYLPVIDTSFTRNPAIAGRFTLSRSLVTLAQHSGLVVQITLTVSWRSYDGRNLSRSYTTYIGQKGLHDYFYNGQT